MNYATTLFAKLQQLEATPGKNDKLAIIKTFTPDELRLVKLAVDPGVNFYIAQIPSIQPHTAEWGQREEHLLLALNRRDITGGTARDAVVESLTWLSPEHGELLRRVILKDLKCGVGVTLVNTAFPGAIVEQPYMRCSLPDKSNLKKWGPAVWIEGVYSDEKADGMFAALTTSPEGSVSLASRQGSTFPPDALPALHTVHKPLLGTQLHGELLVLDQDEKLLERQVGNGILNSLLQGGDLPAGHTVCYLVWDVIPYSAAVPGGKCDTEMATRRQMLKTMVEGHDHIAVIPHRVVHSLADATAHYNELLAEGKEGTIVKNPFGVWKDTTSKDCVKFKLAVNVDLKLIGFVPGNGKNAATFGSARMSTACGQLVVDVSGFTDAARADIWARREHLLSVERVFTVCANQVLKPGPNNELHSLFLPRVVEERLDKVNADTLDEVLAQFAAAVGAK